MKDYFINYAEANIFCLIIFGILLVHDLLNTDRQEKQIKFDRALVAFMCYFASDTLWAAVIAGLIPKTMFTVIAANVLNAVILALVTYSWLNYVMAFEQAPHRERAINKFAVIFPFLVSTVALIATYAFAPGFLIDGDLNSKGIYQVFLIGVSIIYIIAVILYAIRRARKEENPIERRKHIYIGFFPLIVLFTGLLQVLVLPDTALFCYGCTLLMLIFYIQSMDAQISTDPLTGLNNRGQLIRYVTQKTNLFPEDRPTYVIMIDVNDFKVVNDTYGHAEGDSALVLIGDALKTVERRCTMPLFLARYGGDEFILIAHPGNEAEVTQLIADIRTEIEAAYAAHELPYRLTVGIGCDELKGGEDTFQRCLARADHKLYLDKEYVKLNEAVRKTADKAPGPAVQ